MKSHYATAQLKGEAKYEYWHEVVERNFANADSINTCEGEFNAELICNKFGRTTVSHFSAPKHSWQRTKRHVRADDQDFYLLTVFRSGEGVLKQNDNTVQLVPGRLALYDTRLPFEFELSGSHNLIVLPRSSIDFRIPDVRRLLAQDLGRNNGLNSILVELIDSLLESDIEDGCQSVVKERLAEALFNVFLAIVDLNCSPLSGNGRENPSLRKMLHYANANLCDPDLDPDEIAKSGGVSKRTMNRLFGDFGTTPMRWVLRQRINLAAHYMREGKAQSVTDAAFMVGFNDMSHFSRTFKKIAGASPKDILESGSSQNRRDEY